LIPSGFRLRGFGPRHGPRHATRRIGHQSGTGPVTWQTEAAATGRNSGIAPVRNGGATPVSDPVTDRDIVWVIGGAVDNIGYFRVHREPTIGDSQGISDCSRHRARRVGRPYVSPGRLCMRGDRYSAVFHTKLHGGQSLRLAPGLLHIQFGNMNLVSADLPSSRATQSTLMLPLTVPCRRMPRGLKRAYFLFGS